MNKLIFLDVDGVMNNLKYIKSIADGFDNPYKQMDPAAVKLLNKITDTTGAKIVISSTWRLQFTDEPIALALLINGYGITGSVIGMTDDQGPSRVNEIYRYYDHYRPDQFVIFDDDWMLQPGCSDYEKMADFITGHFLKTHFDLGLTDRHVRKAIEILGSI